jgi:hypothetical protein
MVVMVWGERLGDLADSAFGVLYVADKIVHEVVTSALSCTWPCDCINADSGDAEHYERGYDDVGQPIGVLRCSMGRHRRFR